VSFSGCCCSLLPAWAQTEQRPVIKEAGGYWPVPKAAVQPDKTHVFKAIFDVTRAASSPSEFVPGIEDAAEFINELAATGVPVQNRKVALIFHGDAVFGIFDDATYRAKYGSTNPNLKVLRALRAAGAELYVCGQLLHMKNLDPSKVTPDVKVATDALIVLVTYENRGYALLSY
jgi:intracellular sulfur oxidation DsrE/DsrF family protein